MASLFSTNNTNKVVYSLSVPGKKAKKLYPKKRKNIAEAEKIKREVEELEDSADLRFARVDQIEYWINQEYITPDHAEFLFQGFTAKKKKTKDFDDLVFVKLRQHFSKHYTNKSKDKHHDVMMAQLDSIFSWMKEHVDNLSNLSESHAHKFLEYITMYAEQKKVETIIQPDGEIIRMKKVGYAPGTARQFMLQFHAIARVLVTGHCCSKNQRPQCPPSDELAGILESYEGDMVNTAGRNRETHQPSLPPDIVEWVLENCFEEKLLLGGAFPTAMYLARYLGPRNEETAFLQWEHIETDFLGYTNRGKHGVIVTQGSKCPFSGRWNGPKNGEKREADIHPRLYPVLKDEYKKQIKEFGFRTKLMGKRKIKIPNSYYVIPSLKIVGWIKHPTKPIRELNKMGPIWPREMAKALGKFLKRNGQEVFGYYAWRRTFATDWFRENGNPRTLQQIMGHKDLKTTMKYADPADIETGPIANTLP